MLTGELYAELEEERNERRAMLEMRNEDNAQNYQEEEIKTREMRGSVVTILWLEPPPLEPIELFNKSTRRCGAS